VRELTIICEPYPSAFWRETVVRGVDQHNVASTGLADYYPVGFVIRGARGEVLGGLLGDIWGGWMWVGSLWVDPSLRGRGFGAALMAQAHHYALEKSCTHSHLRTGSYEARPFYEKLGYTVYAELKDHPIAPHVRYFLSTRLDPNDAADITANHPVIQMEPYVSSETAGAIRIGISSHAYAAMGLPEQAWWPHNFFLRDERGEIVGERSATCGVPGSIWTTCGLTAHSAAEDKPRSWLPRLKQRRLHADAPEHFLAPSASRRGPCTRSSAIVSSARRKIIQRDTFTT
jgi:GNAT superfamily N-acetyltransferase